MPRGFVLGDMIRSFYSLFEPRESHKAEQSPLKSFALWSSSAQSDPEKLAAAGFFYTGDDDTCQCFFCGLKLRNWRRSNDPWDTHRRYASHCVLIRGEACGNVPLIKKDKMSNEHQAGQDNPLHNIAKRLETFCKWPKSHVVRPEYLARDGFYFTGDRDKVQCAYCHVKLLNWQLGDTAYSEHFKYSPNCPRLQEIGSERQRAPHELEKREFEPLRVAVTAPGFGLSVVRQFGFDDNLVNMALYRLKKKHGM